MGHQIFQYISCYCLSLWNPRNIAFIKHFNTSHVTVYHILRPSVHIISKFQYISCYCLSCRNCAYMRDLGFQYISCYCLSIREKTLMNNNPHFNTSHVTVYQNGFVPEIKWNKFQYISCYCLSRSWIMGRYYQKISIHLMLLFIEIWKREQNDEGAFQYISCYCLSADSKRPQNCGLLFQYISCYCLS